MEKRLRMFLAFAVTLMMLMQSIAPAITVAQDTAPEGSPAAETQPVDNGNQDTGDGQGSDGNEGAGDGQGNGGDQGTGSEDNGGDQGGNAPAAPTEVWLDQVQVNVNWLQAACGVPSSLNVDGLVYNTTQIASVTVLDADQINVVRDLRDGGAAFQVNSDGGTFWLKVVAAEGYAFSVDGVNWLSDDNGASARTKMVFNAVDCAVTLPAPASFIVDNEDGTQSVDVTSLEGAAGIASVKFVPAEDVVAGDDSTGDPSALGTVEVVLANGYTNHADNTANGWTQDEAGVISADVVPVPNVAGRDISPMSTNDAQTGITGFRIVPSSIDAFTETVDFEFDYIFTAGDTPLQVGDYFEFEVPEWALVNYGNVACEPLLFDQDGPGPNPPVSIGCASLTNDGHGRVELTFLPPAFPNIAGGTFSFGKSAEWAKDLAEEERTDIDFSVTNNGPHDDLTASLSIPPKEAPPEEPDPKTEPFKNGWFANGDQGRTERDGAIWWYIEAPEGPTGKTILTDTAGLGWTWSDCSTFSSANYDWNDDADTIADKTITCDAGVITVTFPTGYAAGLKPGVTVQADVTTDVNPIPADPDNLVSNQYKNVVNVEVWKRGSDPEGASFGTGTAEKTITQSGIPGSGALNPSKSGWFVDGTRRTDQAPSEFWWEVRGPSGPVDQVILIDTDADANGWQFDCSTFELITTTSSAATAPAPGSVTGSCVPDPANPGANIIAVNIGAYNEPQSWSTPGFRVKAIQTAEQPEYLREVLTFKNTATSNIKPYKTVEWTGERPTNEASLTQWPVAEPNTTVSKTGEFTGRDKGRFNKNEAIEWIITLPTGPNGKVTMSDPAAAGMWKFSCPTVPVEILESPTMWPGDATTPASAISCTSGLLSINFPNGYASGKLKIKVTVDVLADYNPDPENPNIFANDATIVVGDWLEVTEWGDGGEKTVHATDEQKQDLRSSGTGWVRGEPGEFKVSIGDIVWVDWNKNGLQDAGEPPVGNVGVSLYKADGTFVASTSTNAQGYYWFTDLDSDTEYYLEFQKPATFVNSAGVTVVLDGWTTQGGDPVDDEGLYPADPSAWIPNDSNVDPATNRVYFIAPTMGANQGGPEITDNPTLDAGLIPGKVSVGDRVWFDKNKDGLQGVDITEEFGISGVSVTITGPNGFSDTTTTDANGYYWFTGLDPLTEYTITFNLPANSPYDDWTTVNYPKDSTKQDPADWIANDSDATKIDELTSSVTFTSPGNGNNLPGAGATDNPNLDAGVIIKKVSVGDYVWIDANANGLQDAGETPVAGVLVTLLNADGSSTGRTATTDSNGYYYFTDLEPKTGYQLQFSNTPAGYVWTTQNAGADNIDSDVDMNGWLAFTSPEFGQNKPWSPTAPYVKDMADDPTLDAGLVKLVSVGDYVWYDVDRDGIQEAGEPPVAGVNVTLYRLDAPFTPIATDTTDANGWYSFTDLRPNVEYFLVFEKPAEYTEWTLQDQGGDDALDSDVNQNGIHHFLLMPSTSNNVGRPEGTPDDPTRDAGLVKKVSIGDYVWFDDNFNGLQDEAADRGVAGALVELFDKDGNKLDEYTTGADGYYFFKDLKPDTDYQLKFTHNQPGYGWTKQDTPANDAIDSDVNMQGWITNVHTPNQGQNLTAPGKTDVPTYDAGIVKLVSVGDYVWFDYDRDGVQGTNPKEEPIKDVKVTLKRVDGTEPDRVAYTDADGYYGFKDLYPGADYELTFEKPANYDDWTLQNAGADDAKDSDVDPAGKIAFKAPVTPNNNQIGHNVADDPTLDAGLVIKKVSIGDFVWYDTNLDGIQDPGEPVAPGIKVTLFDKDGNELSSTTTDANGYYYFRDLEPKTEYSVVFEKPANYAFTKQNIGDDAKDSDADKDGKVTFTTPEFGKNQPWPEMSYVKDLADDPTIDAGLVKLVSVGDYVWFDENRDGIQDPTEVPVKDVKVTLYDKDGNVVGTTTTDANGFYSFNNLYPDADYYLIFEKPDGYAGWTTQNVGDDAKDSDVNPAGRVDFRSPKTGNNSLETPDDPTLDAGLIRLVSIGDYVWYDSNGNGKQDPGEKPAKGIKVELFDKDGNKVGETTTDGDGYYYFKDLEPSTQYKLKFTKPAGYNWTGKDAGDNDEIDSDVDINGEITFITPEKGNNLIGPNMTDNPTLDAGLVLIPSPDEPPVVKELPKTGSGAETSSMIVLATLAGAVMMAGAVRLSVNKRS